MALALDFITLGETQEDFIDKPDSLNQLQSRIKIKLIFLKIYVLCNPHLIELDWDFKNLNLLLIHTHPSSSFLRYDQITSLIIVL